MFVSPSQISLEHNVSVAATEELVERGALEAKETALHRTTQVSYYATKAYLRPNECTKFVWLR